MARVRATHFLSRLPPPLLFAGTFLVGLGIQRRVWPHVARLQSGVTIHAVGIGLVAAAVTLALVSAGLFALHRTTLVPHGQASRFVTTGFYRFSRNPMYLGLTVAYLGAALWLEAWLALGLLALPLVVVATIVIPMEEAQLRQRFGADYEAYCRRVRRWL